MRVAICVNIWVHLWGSKTCKRKLDEGWWQKTGFPGCRGGLGNSENISSSDQLFSCGLRTRWGRKEGVLFRFLFPQLSYGRLSSCLMGNGKMFLENDTTWKCVEQGECVRAVTTFFWEFPVMLVCSAAFLYAIVSLSGHSGFLIAFEKLVVRFWSPGLLNRV